MVIDYPEQLLTPENSRSETSSNNENASNEEKPTLRRRSTRVARASLQGAAPLPVDLEKYSSSILSPAPDNELLQLAGTGEEALPATNVAETKRSQVSHLRHSIAVMEQTMWTETALAQNTMDVDDHPMAPDTPVSKSSQEPQSGDMSTSLQQRTLRKRVERVLTEENPPSSKKDADATKPQAQEPTRRSSRLSILEKASGLVDRAGSVLGKRSRGVMEKGKDLGRRASLRPRQPVAAKEELAASKPSEPPAAKKRRVSESDLPSKAKENEEAAQDAPVTTIVPRRTKRWLVHGLYSGQEQTNSARPLQGRNKAARRRSQVTGQRTVLPMPMFAGDRLLQQGRDFQLPFDVFSPLPPGQPKPNEWRKTNKNVFVGEASSIWRANKEEELSKCTCTEETGCDDDCQNRYMFYECDEGNCGLGPECGNRSFDELKYRTRAGGKYNIGVEVIKTEDRGYGVRSNRTFEPNQIIVEYTGEIITQTECEKRMRSIYKNNECYYLMYFDQNMIIDATRGSIARFVNHSCEPNCRMEKWTVAGKPRMALFAGDRGITTGQELTYDYNFDPYSQKNVQQCRCGSSNCRGILGPRPKEKSQRSKEKDAKAESQKKSRSTTSKASRKVTNTKRRVEKALEGSTSRLNKRKLLGTQSLKAGVKKAVSKARSTTTQRSSKATGTTKNAPKQSPARKRPVKKDETKSAKNVKLPKVKATTKAKTTVRVQKPARSTPAQTKAKASQSPTKLSRPSETTKAKIIAAAKGTSARSRTTQKNNNTTGSPKKATKGSPTKATAQSKVASPRAKATAPRKANNKK
ncbi:putative histone-lysine N-methyltransferase [Aspergillus steynii IBT 23096]|uniref:Putative histone-lysine N-methyltransferase n=1 Tax=Aspergillus steynii IBT 23096 TaxID=1392250 RepID=A0A2I2GHM3_9EURO|nr:putative histone-lysine N-methyltransferase [Aspergillus steynii IBT 23096]PLB52383.1 putative histone-lysine N-methyltransferase [Aspergillus steynii IBT 23096]